MTLSNLALGARAYSLEHPPPPKTMSVRPKLVAFDLDATLWDTEMYLLSGCESLHRSAPRWVRMGVPPSQPNIAEHIVDSVQCHSSSAVSFVIGSAE